MRVQAVCLTLLLTLVLYSKAQYVAFQSATRYQNLTTDFSISWYTYGDGTNTPMIRVIMLLKNQIITSWSSQGTNGNWMGIGWGKTNMTDIDMNLCTLQFFNSSDTYICSDRYSFGHYVPNLDSTRNTVDV